MPKSSKPGACLNICVKELLTWRCKKVGKSKKSFWEKKLDGFWKEMVASNFYVEILKSLITCIQGIVHYTLYSSAEVWDPTWFFYNSVVAYNPNEIDHDGRPIHNWRRRTRPGTNLKFLKMIPKDILPSICAALITSVFVHSYGGSSKAYCVTGAAFQTVQLKKYYSPLHINLLETCQVSPWHKVFCQLIIPHMPIALLLVQHTQ